MLIAYRKLAEEEDLLKGPEGEHDHSDHSVVPKKEGENLNPSCEEEHGCSFLLKLK